MGVSGLPSHTRSDRLLRISRFPKYVVNPLAFALHADTHLILLEYTGGLLTRKLTALVCIGILETAIFLKCISATR